MTPERHHIAGVPADRTSLDLAEQVVSQAARGDRPFPVLVTNANKAWLASRDPRLRAILHSAALAVPEYAMEWGARRLGLEGIQHVRGIGLMERLLGLAEREGHSVYLLGSTADTVAALARRLRLERPSLPLAGWRDGYMDEAAWEDLVSELDRVRPALLFVAMGSPLQEYRIAELADRLPGLRVAMGVGGTFEVLAGRKKDAPRWAHGSGLEWVLRLFQDPRRLFRRYAITNTWFVWAILRQRLSGR